MGVEVVRDDGGRNVKLDQAEFIEPTKQKFWFQ